MRTRFGSGSSNCCCDNDCLHSSDDFNRPDTHPDHGLTGHRLGADPLWLSQNRWAIRSQVVQNTSPAAVSEYDQDEYAFVDNVTDAGFDPNEVARVQVKIRTEGDRGEVLICRADSGTWLGAELRATDVDCGQFFLFEVVDRAKNYLAGPVPLDTANLNEYHTIQVCFRTTPGYGYDDEAIAGELSGKVVTASGETISLCVAATPGSPRLAYRSGFGSDKASGGDAERGFDPNITVQFDNFFQYRISDEDSNCPDCEAKCVLGEDDFSDGVLSCRWRDDSGTWTETGGELVVTGAGFIVYDVPHPHCDEYGMRATVTVRDVIAGRIVRVVVDFMDEFNYHFVQFEYTSGNGRLSLYRREGGSDTLLDGPTSVPMGSPASDLTLTACFTEGVLFGTAAPASFPSITVEAETESVGGEIAGLQTNGDATFDDWEVSRTTGIDQDNTTPCERCGGTAPCVYCVDGIKPDFVVVRSSDWRTARPPYDTCSDCVPGFFLGQQPWCPGTDTEFQLTGDFNGTFILPHVGDLIRGFGSVTPALNNRAVCAYRKIMPGSYVNGNYFIEFFYAPYTEGRYIAAVAFLKLSGAGGFGGMQFERVIEAESDLIDEDGKLKCFDFNDFVLLPYQNGNSGGVDYSDASIFPFPLCALVEVSAL